MRLSNARVMVLFTPELCPPGRSPEETLERLVPCVDAIQVRVKTADGQSPAGPLHTWTERVLEIVRASSHDPLVLVNDRVDVALALLESGLAGVHLGTEDMSPEKSRELLGDAALIGLSTHTTGQVAAAQERPLDYVGFGPIFPTQTKGYEKGLGPEPAWIASQASLVPLFAIGGIGLDNVAQLGEVGRIAVSSALLSAEDPARSARGLREALNH